MQYDTTKLQLKVESKELEEKKKKYELEQAEKELTKLQNTAPYVAPVIPEPEPEPTPTPVPESQAELYTCLLYTSRLSRYMSATMSVTLNSRLKTAN